MSEEQFREWVRRGSHLPLAVRGHSFVIERENIIKVDGGRFVYEEALQLVRMLNSKNPVTQINASVMIWERNGILRIVVILLVVIILATVILLARH